MRRDHQLGFFDHPALPASDKPEVYAYENRPLGLGFSKRHEAELHAALDAVYGAPKIPAHVAAFNTGDAGIARGIHEVDCQRLSGIDVLLAGYEAQTRGVTIAQMDAASRARFGRMLVAIKPREYAAAIVMLRDMQPEGGAK